MCKYIDTNKIINTNAPTNGDNRKYPENVKKFWDKPEMTMSHIHHYDVNILLGGFNAQLGKEKLYRKTIDGNSAHPNTNTNGTRIFTSANSLTLKPCQHILKKKTPHKQETCRSPINHLEEYHIDHSDISYKHYRTIHNMQD